VADSIVKLLGYFFSCRGRDCKGGKKSWWMSWKNIYI